MFLPALALAADASAPGQIKTFTDWAVACDNVRRCEMTSLEPMDGATEIDGTALSVTREAGPTGAVVVTLSLPDTVDGARTLAVDGKRVATGRAEKGALRFTGAEALRIAAALAEGRHAGVEGRGGNVSLAGAAAALRFIDAQQGRAGGVTALVARGTKPATAVPAPPPLPVIRAVSSGRHAAPLSRAQLATLNRISGCAENYMPDFPQPEADTGALGGGATLVLLPCGAGAYNQSSTVYVLRGGKPALARFTAAGAVMDETLINASWDARTGTLSSYAKGRGLGDCGEAADYVWDGTRFRATALHRMDDCRGSTNWLTVWRAAVRR